jgi:hypothetical protein
MPRAIPIPSHDGKDNRALAGIVLRRSRQAREKRWFVGYLCASPKLEAPSVFVIHEKKERLRIFSQVTCADVLPIAPVFRESYGSIVQHLEGRPPAVLNIWLAIGACRGKVSGIALTDERHGICGPKRTLDQVAVTNRDRSLLTETSLRRQAYCSVQGRSGGRAGQGDRRVRRGPSARSDRLEALSLVGAGE